jgi:hypothetical protein
MARKFSGASASTEAATEAAAEAAGKVAKIILNYVAAIPASSERKSRSPDKAARKKANSAAVKAALAAGTFAIPPGGLGWLTILPEMKLVWKIQTQLVADVAALYGKNGTLTQEQMLYCLFRHSASQAVRDLVVRVGDRTLLRPASVRALRVVAERIAVRVTRQAIGKGFSRWLPFVGAVGVGAYAYYDTASVASTAIDLFEREIDISSSIDHS